VARIGAILNVTREHQMNGIVASDYSNTEREYLEVCDFLDVLSVESSGSLWDSGRMNFWRHSVHADKDPNGPFFVRNAHLWRDGNGEIVALCISEYGKNDLFIEVMPDRVALYPRILEWIDRVWAAERGTTEIDVFADDRAKISHLETAGYVFRKHSENKRTFDLGRIPLDYRLEEGFAIRTLEETEDFDGRVALVRNAFDNPNYTLGKLRGLTESPDHVSDWDLMVISDDGIPVAYCCGWRERATPDRGHIEPVGTHNDYRRRGFAQAVIRECFARMRGAGIRTAEIAARADGEAANGLYESLSPSSRREVYQFAKSSAPR
jgi:ribosomal protein S18 acetylase RimI-like enzyme